MQQMGEGHPTDGAWTQVKNMDIKFKHPILVKEIKSEKQQEKDRSLNSINAFLLISSKFDILFNFTNSLDLFI